MDQQTFSKIIRYLEIYPGDPKANTLEAIFCHGFTRTQASQAFGLGLASVGQLVDRALRDLRRAGDLTGVYIEPVVRRGSPGRRKAP